MEFFVPVSFFLSFFLKRNVEHKLAQKKFFSAQRRFTFYTIFVAIFLKHSKYAIS